MSLHMVAHTATITVTIIQDNEGEKEKKRKENKKDQIIRFHWALVRMNTATMKT